MADSTMIRPESRSTVACRWHALEPSVAAGVRPHPLRQDAHERLPGVRLAQRRPDIAAIMPGDESAGR